MPSRGPATVRPGLRPGPGPAASTLLRATGQPRRGGHAAIATLAIVTFCVPLTALQHYPSVRLALLPVVLLGASRLDPTLRRRLVNVPLVAFFAVCYASVIWSENRQETVNSLANLTLEIAAGAALVACAHPTFLVRALKAILVASVVVSLALPGIGQTSNDAWRGFFSHKNSLGIATAFAVVVFASARVCRHRVLWTAGGLAVLLLSQSRGALIAAVGTLVVTLTARAIFNTRLNARRLPSAFFYVSLASLMVLTERGAATILNLLGRDPDLTGRTEVWDAVLRYGASHRLLGSGPGAQIYRGSALYEQISLVGRRNALGTTHNGLLAVYLGLGIVGCVLLIVLLVHLYTLVHTLMSEGGRARADGLLPLALLSCYVLLNAAEDMALTRTGPFFITLCALYLHAAVARRAVPDDGVALPP